jgi:hypothetical protein
MKRILDVTLAVAIAAAAALGTLARADDSKTTEILDKAIKALGGAEKLEKAQATSEKAKGKLTIEGNENSITSQAITQGIDRHRGEFEGEFNGNKFKGLSILNGDKGWRMFGDMVMEMDQDAVKNEKRSVYLSVVAETVLPLKGKGFKVESAPDEKVGGKPAAGIKATGPDGKDFTLYFDKDTGLPVRMVAKVAGWMGDEYTQDVLYSDYKEFDGIKKATKVSIKRDGDPFLELELTEFKVLDKVPSDTFAEPK